MASALAAGLLGLLLLGRALPAFSQLAGYSLAATLSIGGLPVLVLSYPAYILLCIGLALDALRLPGPSARLMGEQARSRARPWLAAASVGLLVVGLLVGWAIGWVVVNLGRSPGLFQSASLPRALAWFDLVIAAGIGLAVLAVGQAVVVYEIFTGKALPRQGLKHHWRRVVILAGGYSLVVSWSLATQLRPVYSLLLTAVLMTTFYALLSWRMSAERQQTIAQLRPFLASPRLYDQLATPSLDDTGPADEERTAALPGDPFQALCVGILGTRHASLAPLGAMTPLIGQPLTYPAESVQVDRGWLSELVAGFTSPSSIGVPLNPSQAGGFVWAVPLWSERGLIGALLLGEKSDGGLYTQEEIEIARTASERILDLRASAEMAARLAAVQRKRMAENQVLDRRVRRTLHDEVLPRLHAAMLALNEQGETHPETLESLAGIHRQISDLLRGGLAAAPSQVARLGVLGALRRYIEDELPGAFEQVSWNVSSEAESQAWELPGVAAETLFFAACEAVRNAARHARNNTDTPLHLRVSAYWKDRMIIVVEDNGQGFTPDHAPEPTHTSSGEGSGQGLVLHSTMMAIVGGSLAIESLPGAYTRVQLQYPAR